MIVGWPSCVCFDINIAILCDSVIPEATCNTESGVITF